MITLGIDCGTQSTKAVALDLDTGEVIAQAAVAYQLLPGLPPGHTEQHPSTWTNALEEAMARVLARLGGKRPAVAGIGVSGQQHGFVALDATHQVIRPAKLWCDTSTIEECGLIAEALGGRKTAMALTGLDMLPGYTAPKILWLKRHEPANFARLAHVLLPHDYLNLYLGGALGMEYGDASGTALFDVRERRWSREVCSAIDPELFSKLPPVGSSRQAVGTLRPALARQWGLSSRVVISAGGGDNMMGALGTGNVKPGRVTASLGTSGTIYAYSRQPVVDSEGEIAAFCDSTDAWLPLVCTMNVTVATEQTRRLFDWSYADFEKAAASAPAGANGVLFLPYLQGERTPNFPGARGSFHGLSADNHTRENVARATMEGVTLGMAYGLERLRASGIAPQEIRLIGGGSQSRLWRSLCADIFNAPVATLENAESAAFGAAIQAAAVARPEKTVEEWSDLLVATREDETMPPDPERSALYRQLQEEQQRLAFRLHERGA